MNADPVIRGDFQFGIIVIFLAVITGWLSRIADILKGKDKKP